MGTGASALAAADQVASVLDKAEDKDITDYSKDKLTKEQRRRLVKALIGDQENLKEFLDSAETEPDISKEGAEAKIKEHETMLKNEAEPDISKEDAEAKIKEHETMLKNEVEPDISKKDAEAKIKEHETMIEKSRAKVVSEGRDHVQAQIDVKDDAVKDSCANEVQTFVDALPASTLESKKQRAPEKWLRFTRTHERNLECDRIEHIGSKSDNICYDLCFHDGVTTGSTVKLVITRRETTMEMEIDDYSSKDDHYYWHDELKRICAECIVVSVEGSSVVISVEKVLSMEEHTDVTDDRDDFVKEKHSMDFPWKLVDKVALGKVLTKIQSIDQGMLKVVDNSRVSHFGVELNDWCDQAPWTYNDYMVAHQGEKYRNNEMLSPSELDCGHLRTIELLYRKWDSLQLFIMKKHEFYFLSAERLRGHTGPLPKFQDLVLEGGWLSKKTLSIRDVMKQTYAKSVLTVSHTWFAQGKPFNPEDNVKMQALSTYLMDNMEVEEVWLDYGCVPQEPRTEEEQMLFDHTLPVINLLYLGTKVLRIIGKEYFERFWPQFESYLSKQSIHKYGFKSEKSDRCSTTIIDGKADDYASHIAFFDACTYDEAVDRLSGDGVKVTSKKDKETCLTKLCQLKEFMAVIFNTLD